MDVEMTLRVLVRKDPTNEATAWIPPAKVVAAEVADLLVDLDLDTGWVITDVSA